MTFGRALRWLAPMAGATLLLAACPAPGTYPPGAPNQQCPVAGKVRFGQTIGAPRDGGTRSHEGIDIFSDPMLPEGRPILAAESGRITRAQNVGGNSGGTINLVGDSGRLYIYRHLQTNSWVGRVQQGDRVSVGLQIARLGSTGNASPSAPHLHLEIWSGGSYGSGLVNPLPWAQQECNGTAQPSASAPPPYNPYFRGMAHTPNGQGYWFVGRDGGVFSFGNANFYGSLPGLGVNVSNIKGIAATPNGGGYWLVGSDGGVFSFGNAQYKGSLPGVGVNKNNVVGIEATKSGNGYWIVSRDGGVFSFGDAQFYGSVPGLDMANPNNIMGMARTKSGGGYFLVGADGGVYSFGDARFDGSVPGIGISTNKVTGLAIDKSDGRGYWLVANDGAVYSFQAPFHGRASGLNEPAMGLVSTPGSGYWIWAGDGGVFAKGDAPFKGSGVGLGP